MDELVLLDAAEELEDADEEAFADEFVDVPESVPPPLHAWSRQTRSVPATKPGERPPERSNWNCMMSPLVVKLLFERVCAWDVQ